jgi:hypothetical protein
MNDSTAPEQDPPPATDNAEMEDEVPSTPQGYHGGHLSPGSAHGSDQGLRDDDSQEEHMPDQGAYERGYSEDDIREHGYDDQSMQDDGYDDDNAAGQMFSEQESEDRGGFLSHHRRERETPDSDVQERAVQRHDVRGHDVRGHDVRGHDGQGHDVPGHEKSSRRSAIASSRERDAFGRFVPGQGHRDRNYGGHHRGQVQSPDPSGNLPNSAPPKERKKPGPKPKNPPILKNDLQAKKLIIRQIEGHWGKDFIKNYIPKVHRPLVKRKKGKARTHNRKHEDDPMKWLPSILKAMLSLARLTDDKARLKKLMGDVVRYRNQHTGNKKPQLVTTDFDVIEDMVERGWSVKQSFEIRYKHLLTNRMIVSPLDTNSKDQEEYYKHLFRGSSDGSSSEEEVINQDDDDADGGMEFELTNEYQLQSGYCDASPQQYQPPPRYNPEAAPGYRQTPSNQYRPESASGHRQTPSSQYYPDPAPGYRQTPSSQYRPESTSGRRQTPSSQYHREPVPNYRPPPAPMVMQTPTHVYHNPTAPYQSDSTYAAPGRHTQPGTSYRPEQMRPPDQMRRQSAQDFLGYDQPSYAPETYTSHGYHMPNRGEYPGIKPLSFLCTHPTLY